MSKRNYTSPHAWKSVETESLEGKIPDWKARLLARPFKVGRYVLLAIVLIGLIAGIFHHTSQVKPSVSAPAPTVKNIDLPKLSHPKSPSKAGKI